MWSTIPAFSRSDMGESTSKPVPYEYEQLDPDTLEGTGVFIEPTTLKLTGETVAPEDSKQPLPQEAPPQQTMEYIEAEGGIRASLKRHFYKTVAYSPPQELVQALRREYPTFTELEKIDFLKRFFRRINFEYETGKLVTEKIQDAALREKMTRSFLRFETEKLLMEYVHEVSQRDKITQYWLEKFLASQKQGEAYTLEHEQLREQVYNQDNELDAVVDMKDMRIMHGAVCMPVRIARDAIAIMHDDWQNPIIESVAHLDKSDQDQIHPRTTLIPRTFIADFRRVFGQKTVSDTSFMFFYNGCGYLGGLDSDAVFLIRRLADLGSSAAQLLLDGGNLEFHLHKYTGLEQSYLHLIIKSLTAREKINNGENIVTDFDVTHILEDGHEREIYESFAMRLGGMGAWIDPILARMDKYEKDTPPLELSWMPVRMLEDGDDDEIMPSFQEAPPFLKLLSYIHDVDIRIAIESDIGFSLTSLTMREQAELLNYISRSNTETNNALFTLLKTNGVNAARAFLSCEYGTHYGDAILDIGTRLSPDDARAVFDRYADVVDAIEVEVERVLTGKDGISPALRERVVNEVLSRAKDVIALGGRGARGEIDAELIMNALESYRRDTIAFVSIFKHASDKDLAIESLGNISFETLRGGGISPDDKRAIIELAQGNWAIDKPEAWPMVQGAIMKGLESSSSTWYVFRLGGTIEAFVRFEDRVGDRGVRYGGNFNTSRGMRGAMLGEHFLARAVEVEAVDHVIEAVFFPSVRAGSMYIEKMGFVGVGVNATPLTDREKSPQIQIRRDNALIKTLKTRSWHRADIARASIDRQSGDVVVAKFTMPDEEELFAHRIGEMTRSGYVLSRYVYPGGGEKGGLAYVVFEKPSQPADEEPQI